MSLNKPQAVVYKTKKCVYWITHNNEEKQHTDVFFYTSRKAAVKQLSSLVCSTTSSLALCLHSLSLSLVMPWLCLTIVLGVCRWPEGESVAWLGWTPQVPSGPCWSVVAGDTWALSCQPC